MIWPVTLVDGEISVTTDPVGAGTVWNGGLAYDSNGALHVNTTDAIEFYVGGLPVTGAGALAVDSGGTGSGFYVGGLQINTEGRVMGVGSGVTLLLGPPTFGDDGKLVADGWSDARTTAIIIPDEEGVLRSIPAETLACPNARYVRNYLENAQDVTGGTKTGTGVTAVANGDGSYRVTLPPASGIYCTTLTNGGTKTFYTGEEIRVSGCIKYVSGSSTDMRLFESSGQFGGPSILNVQDIITTSWKRLASLVGTCIADNKAPGLWWRNVGTGTIVVDIMDEQIEDVTGKTNQNPSEFTLSLDIYNTENGNTVTDGVITEAVGAALSPVPALTHYPAATNLFLNSDAPVTQDITLPVGDWTLSVYGTGSVTSSAGTATGTGYGAATDGSDNTINITAEGTVTFTVAGGPPDYVQVESGVFSTPPVLTAGTSATRTTCDISQTFSSSLFKQVSGFAYIDLTPEQAQTALTATDEGILSVADSATNLLFVDDGNLQSADGTNTAAVDPNYAADTKIRFLVYWDTVGDVLGVGYRTLPGGTYTWATEQSYDGAFAEGTDFNLMYDNLHSWAIHDLGVFNKHQSQTYYEDNY